MINGALIGYIGPEAAMPLLSAIAAVGGALLMFGKTTIRYVFRKICNLFSVSQDEESLEGRDSAAETTS